MKRLLPLATLFLALPLAAQQQPTSDAQRIDNLEHRIDKLTDTLDQTLQELHRLRAELNALKATSKSSQVIVTASDGNVEPIATPLTATLSLEDLNERLDLLAAEIKQHEQTKLESASKYPIRVTGLALFNAYNNAGVVDDSNLPVYALARFPGGSHGAGGATLRQTIVGIEANGPTVAGAQTSASLAIDFFGGSVSNTSGYAASAGYVRLRTGDLTLDWANTTLQAGYTEPLFSPRSPTSYAVVAHPALAGSGNLWAWAPQLRAEQRVPLGASKHTFALEAGLIYPTAYYYTNFQLNSPVNASRHPGVEGRLSYSADHTDPHSFSIGVSAYTARQIYSGGVKIKSWAFAGDYLLPLTHWLELSGEAYRGSAIGGFSGGAYNDVLFANDYKTAAAVVRPVDTAGGWSQLKAHLGKRLEANIAYGLDDSYKLNLDDITLPSTTSSLAQIGRNGTFSGNLVFHPRSNIILSPEYRHIETWYYLGSPNVASIFTLSAGYQF